MTDSPETAFASDIFSIASEPKPRPAPTAESPYFDAPQTQAMDSFIARHGPDGAGAVVGMTTGPDGVCLYTAPALWCDQSGAGTFRGDTETGAIRAFRESAVPGNGCTANPAPAENGPCRCNACMNFAHAVTDTATNERESALAPNETFSTVWKTRAVELIEPVGTVTRPRLYDDPTGLFTLHDTDGNLVKTWSRMPTLKAVRGALAYAAGVTQNAAISAVGADSDKLQDIASDCDADAVHFETQAKERVKGSPGAALMLNLGAMRRARGRAYRAAIKPVQRAARSLSAAATPADLANGSPSDGGSFPARAFRDVSRRCADAIEESLDLFSDPADPFDSVRDFVGYPESRAVVAVKYPGGLWVYTGGAV